VQCATHHSKTHPVLTLPPSLLPSFSPIGMAYAALSNLPAIYGLYASTIAG
jgi:MFS superfamily sulfate permease-like transporter